MKRTKINQIIKPYKIHKQQRIHLKNCRIIQCKLFQSTLLCFRVNNDSDAFNNVSVNVCLWGSLCHDVSCSNISNDVIFSSRSWDTSWAPQRGWSCQRRRLKVGDVKQVSQLFNRHTHWNRKDGTYLKYFWQYSADGSVARMFLLRPTLSNMIFFLKSEKFQVWSLTDNIYQVIRG